MNLIEISTAILMIGCELTTRLMNVQNVSARLVTTPVVDVSGVHPVTKPEFGYTTEVPGLYGQAFIRYANSLGRPAHVADIGAGWRGVDSLPLIFKGHHVNVVDASKEELHAYAAYANANIETRASRDTINTWKSRVKLYHGSLPETLPFADDSLDAVMLGSVLHFLEGKDIIGALREVYRVLRPGGKVFIEAQTPYMIGLNDFRRERNEFLSGNFTPRWPWQIDNREGRYPVLGPVKYLNLFDRPTILRTLRETRFLLDEDEVGYFARQLYPDAKEFHTDLPELRILFSEKVSIFLEFESVGGIGTKPLKPGGSS